MMHRNFGKASRISTAIVLCICTIFFACKTPGDATQNNNSGSNKKLTQAEQMQLTALFIDANREIALGNNDKALGLLAQCIKRDVQYGPAMYEMARLLQERKQFNDALVLALGAVKSDPNNEWYQLLLAGIYIERQEYSEAAKVMKMLSEHFSNKPDYIFNLADIYIMDGKFNDAIKVYDQIEETHGVSEDISLQKEKLYLQMNKVNKAVEEIEKLVQEFPEEVKYMVILADLYLTTGNEFKGLAMYDRILTISPENPYAHLSLADYYKMQNKEDKSFQEMQAAFSSPEMDIDTKVRIMMQYYQLSKDNPTLQQQSWVLLKIITEVHPNEAKAWSIYGDFLYRDKQMEKAAVAFRNATQLDDTRYAVWEQLLYLDSGLEHYDTLLMESTTAMELFPEQGEPYLYHGFAAIRLKDYATAIKTLKAGLSFATGNPLILKFYANLAEASYMLKDYDMAFDYYERALKIEPDNLYILNNYSYFLAQQKRNLGRAEELAHKLTKLEPNNEVYEDTYGWVCFIQEHYALAKTMIGQALSHGGDANPSILEHYGDVLFKLGEKDAALEYWNKAVNAGGKSELLLKKIKEKNWYNE